MKHKFYRLAVLALVVSAVIFSGCSKGGSSSATSKSAANIPGNSADMKTIVDKDNQHLELSLGDNPTLYIHNIADFPEFAEENEGSAFIDSSVSTIYISLTKKVAVENDAVVGPMAVFCVNYETNEVVRADFIAHGEDTIEISNDRMVEIATDLKKMIDDNNK